MDKKPKAGRAPRKAKQKLEDKEQSARFIKTARELCADESGSKFEVAIERIFPSQPKRQNSSKN